jgi:hypothetical protein
MVIFVVPADGEKNYLALELENMRRVLFRDSMFGFKLKYQGTRDLKHLLSTIIGCFNVRYGSQFANTFSL